MLKLFFALWLGFSLVSCSYLIIAKDCAKVADDSDRYMCRQVKPWE